MIGERPAEGEAVAREGAVEGIPQRLHLHVVPQHPLPGIGARPSRGQKRQQFEITERLALILTEAHMGGEGRVAVR